MHDFVNKVKVRLLNARKARDQNQVSILSTVLGEIDTMAMKKGQEKPLSEEQCYKIVRKIIQANDETLESCEAMIGEGGNATCDFDRIHAENDVLESLVPKQLNKGDVENFFAEVGSTEILEAASDGQAIGRAMRALSSAGKSVDGKVVKEVVAEMRK